MPIAWFSTPTTARGTEQVFGKLCPSSNVKVGCETLENSEQMCETPSLTLFILTRFLKIEMKFTYYKLTILKCATQQHLVRS